LTPIRRRCSHTLLSTVLPAAVLVSENNNNKIIKKLQKRKSIITRWEFAKTMHHRINYVWSLTRQFAKSGKWGEFIASVWHPKAERFSASGGLHPRPGDIPTDAAGGPRLAMWVSSVHPTFFWPGDTPVGSAARRISDIASATANEFHKSFIKLAGAPARDLCRCWRIDSAAQYKAHGVDAVPVAAAVLLSVFVKFREIFFGLKHFVKYFTTTMSADSMQVIATNNVNQYKV